MSFEFISEINNSIDAEQRLIEKMTELYGAELVEQLGLNEVSQAAMARAGEREWAQQAAKETGEKDVQQNQQQMKVANKLTGSTQPDVDHIILKGGNQYVIKSVGGSRLNAVDAKTGKAAKPLAIEELKNEYTPKNTKDGNVIWMNKAEMK